MSESFTHPPMLPPSRCEGCHPMCYTWKIRKPLHRSLVHGLNERKRSVAFRGIIPEPMISHSATLHKPTDSWLYLAQDHCTSCWRLMACNGKRNCRWRHGWDGWWTIVTPQRKQTWFPTRGLIQFLFTSLTLIQTHSNK